MKYDAFISYRHGELDGLVAEKLHKLLETYNIPHQIAKKVGKKKLSRVFRDREELPTSSNLSDSINYALENSEFLLLICSKRTCQSQWVMREVERFGELHGKDKIIALLIDGEPDEAFPPGLREREVDGKIVIVEPLAGDIRADSWKKSLNLLKEEKLRLLAPILGCAFDDLRQRHRRRRIQQITAAVSATLLFSISFGAFSTYQYIQINHQMQLKLENQSYVLSEYSSAELESGDTETALLLALSGLPKNLIRPERPLVYEAGKALANSLGVYDLSDGFKPYKTMGLPAAPNKVLLSPDENYAVVIYAYELAIIHTSTGNIVKLPTLPSILADVEFLSNEVLIFTGENGIEAYNFVLGKSIWKGNNATMIDISEDKSIIATVYKEQEKAVLYSPDGAIMKEISFNNKKMSIPIESSFANPHNSLFKLNANGSKLAVSFSDGSLQVFDIDNNVANTVFLTENAFRFNGVFCGDLLAVGVVENEPYFSRFLLYNTIANEIIITYDSEDSYFMPITYKEQLYLAFQDSIMSIDTSTGEASRILSAGGTIVNFQKNSNTFLITLDNGEYIFIGQDNKTYYSDYVCHFIDIGEKYVLTSGYDAKTLRILQKVDHSDSQMMSYSNDYNFDEAKINSKTDRVVFYSYMGMRLYNLNGDILADVSFPRPLEVIDTQYDANSGNVIVVYNDLLLIYSGLDGSLLLEEKGKSVIYTHFGTNVLKENNVVALYDSNTCQPIIEATVENSVKSSLHIGEKRITVSDEGVFFDGNKIAIGEIIGVDKLDNNHYAFAVSDKENGKVFVLRNGILKEAFSFEPHGIAEVYFSGNFAFIAPNNGDEIAYSLDGNLVRTFNENGRMTETMKLGEAIIVNYISVDFKRYSFILSDDTLETIAYIPGLLGNLDNSTIILDYGTGSLRKGKLYTLEELVDMAKQRLDGKKLTTEQTKKYKAG